MAEQDPTTPDRERRERAALAALTMQLRAAEREAAAAEARLHDPDAEARRAGIERTLAAWVDGRRQQFDREADAAQTRAAHRVLQARNAAAATAAASSLVLAPSPEPAELVTRSVSDLLRSRSALPPRPGRSTPASPLDQLAGPRTAPRPQPRPDPQTSPTSARYQPLPPRPGSVAAAPAAPAPPIPPMTAPAPPSAPSSPSTPMAAAPPPIAPSAPAPSAVAEDTVRRAVPTSPTTPKPDPIASDDSIDAWLRAVSSTNSAPPVATPLAAEASPPIVPPVGPSSAAEAEATPPVEPELRRVVWGPGVTSEPEAAPAPEPLVVAPPPASEQEADPRAASAAAAAAPSPAAEEALANGLAAVVPPTGFGYQLVRLDGAPVPVWGGGTPMIVPPGGMPMYDPSTYPGPYDEDAVDEGSFLRRLAHPDVLMPLVAAFLVLVLLLAWLA